MFHNWEQKLRKTLSEKEVVAEYKRSFIASKRKNYPQAIRVDAIMATT